MKKTKLLSSLVLLTSGVGFAAPLITSCAETKVNPIIDEEVITQFESIKTNCTYGQDSTIEFTCKQDQELDANSVEIRMAGVRIKAGQDFKVEGNKVTIFAAAMTNTIVNAKASPKYSHVIDTLKASWVLKPIMQYDEVSAKDIKVELVYKDGEKETLEWNTGYKIYNVVNGEKTELKNFDTTPFVYEEVNYAYNFLIEYAPKPEIKIEVNNIMVLKPTIETFYIRYAQCLERFEETKNSYGWTHFNTNSKFKGNLIASAAIYYDEDYGKAWANFKNSSCETVDVDDFCIGGNTLNTIKSFIDKHSDVYVPTFTNTKYTFGFILKTSGNTITVDFDKNAYVKKFDYGNQSGEYAGTNFEVSNFDEYVKTATIKAKEYEVGPVEKTEITNTSKGESYIANKEGQNAFWGYVYFREFKKDDKRRGNINIYNEENKIIYSSYKHYPNAERLPITDASGLKIEGKMWDSIKHNDTLTLKFDVDKQLKVSLDTTLTNDYTLNLEGVASNMIYEDAITQPDAQFSLLRKDTTVKKFSGTFKLKCQNAQGDEIEIARTEFKEQEVLNPVGTLKFIDNTWQNISVANEIVEATLSFEEARSAGSFDLGNNLKTNFGNVTHTQQLQESTVSVPLEVKWEKPLAKESMFALMNKNGENIYSQLLQPGATSIKFDFLPEWFNKFTSGDTLTFEIKKEADFTVTIPEGKEVFYQYETWGRPTPIIYLYQTFSFKTSENDWDGSNWKLTLSNWKPIKIVGDEWRLWLEGHSVQRTSEALEGYLYVELLVETPWKDPLEGSEYEFTLTFEFETPTTYKRFVFNNFKIKFIEIPPDK